MTLVDESRRTPAGAGLPAARTRTLVTHVFLPERRAPAPLVVFAHGYRGHPRKFTTLLSTWARAGYVVAAPTFPLTNEDVPGEAFRGDVAEQPGDVRFVLDEVLAAHLDRIDPTRVGVAGFSLGAVTVYGVAFGAARDTRVGAAIAMSARSNGRTGVRGGAEGRLPLLVVHAEGDPLVPYADGLAAYRRARPPKALLTLHVTGHHEAFEDGAAGEAGEIVPRATTAFLDLALKCDPGGRDRLLGAAAPPVASLELDGL